MRATGTGVGVIALITAALGAACSSTSAPRTFVIASGETVTLSQGESATLADAKFWITFIRVAYDDRCGPGAEKCSRLLGYDDAAADLELGSLIGDSVVATLHTRADPQSLSFNNVDVRLEGLKAVDYPRYELTLSTRPISNP